MAEEILAPLAGKIIQMDLEVGKAVEEDDEIMVIEAMKMEIAIESDEKGVVKEILCSQGTPVKAGQALVIIELSK